MMDRENYYQNEAVAASYDSARFTSASGKRGDRLEKAAFSRALDRIPDVRTALDVACGTGRMTEVLLERGIKTTGCDVSAEMLQQAERKLARFQDQVTLVQDNARNLAFEDASFDLVTCVRLFGHFPTDVRVQMLCEIARVARKWVIVEYFYRNWITSFKRFVNEKIRRECHRVRHPIGERGLRDEIRRAGLSQHGRMWCRKYLAEEVFVLLVKPGP